MAKIKEHGYEVNRNKYNQIRKYDTNQMQQFVDEIHQRGYKKGQQAAGSFDMNMALESIGEIKGIGEVKLQQIRLVLIAAGARG